MVNHGKSDMSDTAQQLLILGGTAEASALAQTIADQGLRATFSYAGRVRSPKTQPLPTREGGFGGPEGLADYIRQNAITHVIDATHPFAAQMSWNAHKACTQTNTPLAALTRPPWQADPLDRWEHVPDIDNAVAALARPAQRIMLALGRLHMNAFAAQPQHHYVLRVVDTPDMPPLMPHHTVTVARGPFALKDDLKLFQDQRIELLVCKNAGGQGAIAKIHAARALNIPVLMIDRPHLPPRTECATPDQVLDWLASHPLTERGV